MGEALSAVIKELSCHDCARYVFNDASWHSRCCQKEGGDCCDCDVETHQVKPPEEELEIELEADGCFENVCCFLHASKK